MTITPEIWGPHVWQSLHYISLGYPDNPTENQKKKYKAFYLLLKDVLPCSLCANHYGENLNKMPLTDDIFDNREKLVKWVIDIHNVVNEMKEKPIIRYVDARKMIETDSTCKQPIKIIERKNNQKQITNTSKSCCSLNNNQLAQPKIIEKVYTIDKMKLPKQAKLIEKFEDSPIKMVKKHRHKHKHHNNNTHIYYLCGLLIALITIALIYKKV